MPNAEAVCLCGAVLDGPRLPNVCRTCTKKSVGEERHAPRREMVTGFDKPHIAMTPTGAHVRNTWHG